MAASKIMARLIGKAAIITGSSHGIGRATAAVFARDGAKVTITGRDEAALQVTHDECVKAGAKKENILSIIGDITLEKTQSKLVEETVKKFGRLDILVNNHGGPSLSITSGFDNLKLDDFNRTMDVNCKSIMAMCVKALPHLKKTKGEVVNISSIAAMIPCVEMHFYGMAKAALDHLTKSLAFGLAKYDIRVNAINPGYIRTNFGSHIGLTGDIAKKVEAYYSKNAIPMKRIAEPIEIAEPIAFLADRNLSGYMTGQTIVIDGGALLQTSMIAADFASVLKGGTK